MEEISPFEKKFKNMTQDIRDRVVKIATMAKCKEYTIIAMQEIRDLYSTNSYRDDDRGRRKSFCNFQRVKRK